MTHQMGPVRRSINLVLALALTVGSAIALVYLLFYAAGFKLLDANNRWRGGVRWPVLALCRLHQRRAQAGKVGGQLTGTPSSAAELAGCLADERRFSHCSSFVTAWRWHGPDLATARDCGRVGRMLRTRQVREKRHGQCKPCSSGRGSSGVPRLSSLSCRPAFLARTA
jgi:hypothetical protein